MSDPQSESAKTPDPLEQWRELRDVYMDAWAKTMGEAVNSEAYAQTSGTMLETCLTVLSPFRDAQKKAMLNALGQLSMPSQADIVSLAERLTNIELLLDDMDAKLNQIHQLATGAASKAAPEVKASKPVSEAPASEAKSSKLAHAVKASERAPQIKSETKSAASKKSAKAARKGSG
jgi:hypothetical protein